jgi:hypothetical protein
LLNNGFANKHVSTETIALRQWKGVFYAFHAEMLEELLYSCKGSVAKEKCLAVSLKGLGAKTK